MQTQLRGVAAGVPYVAVPPECGPRGDVPTVVAWHLMEIRPVVEALSQQFGVTYAWSAAAEAVARRLDFVARAGEFSSRGEPAVLLVVGGRRRGRLPGPG